MKPSQKYLQIMQESGFVSDPAQQEAITLLDGLQNRLLKQPTRRRQKWWQQFIPGDQSGNRVAGIYFWGGVGRGKTFLMDIFYQDRKSVV